MPDHTIPADKLRELANDMSNWRLSDKSSTMQEDYRELIKLVDSFTDRLNALITPPLPTLADMTPEERQACQWMQAKIRRSDDLVGVIFFLTDDRARIMFRDGTFVTQDHEDVTPLPGEPKMEYPGDGVVDALIVDGEPALSFPEEVKPGDYRLDSRIGNSAVTSLPCPEDVPAGEPWLIAYEGGFHTALKVDDRDSEPWVVSFPPDDGFLWLSDRDVTLISRLVPETPRKTLVTVEDYRNAPVGTVVHEHTGVREKTDRDTWEGHRRSWFSSSGMAGTAREVIWEPAS